MNKVLFICILMIGCLSGQAQAIKTSEVPSVVTAALKKEYPYATNIKWEMQDGMYEASFVNMKAEMAVIYSDKGIMALTETPVEVSALPANVFDYFRTKEQLGYSVALFSDSYCGVLTMEFLIKG